MPLLVTHALRITKGGRRGLSQLPRGLCKDPVGWDKRGAKREGDRARRISGIIGCIL